ncbi:serine/threonine protein kinase [Ammoniphilus sp. CFH 90114]|uniref:serine/threonine protein kinase n=1 Tax=Ammoniphilus sp. CFH 90114 TaxID=2493665 RepID=UPI00100F5600|nr:serine/threonine protein kinase [Ammoniphilus sp. CFH 90114]RXT04534.1 serine/threonine protein kinase [Ammoniphilus sp. CFH 90114]
MSGDWKLAEDALKRVQIIGNNMNDLVSITSCSEQLRCIGIGTDAAVFQYDQTPAYAFKVYSSEALDKKEIEESVYLRIKESTFFPQYYGKGDNYIVLSLEKGITLYDCLIQGIPIPKQAIEEVEVAREFVRLQGLNPRDIHLKNILLQDDGHAKVIDVSEYAKEGNDNRWEHLLWAYDHIYPMIEGVSIPSWVLDTIKQWYKRMDQANFALEEFSQQAIRIFLGNRKS